MPRLAVAVVVAALIWPAGLARAEVSGQPDTFMKDPPGETVYATEHHMGFSLRSSIITWLGGLTIVDDGDLRAAVREQWWGDDVPLVPPDAVPSER
ncbi:MAG TPA: hypothetical protein VGX21_06635 [Methylomirabilota bacterium]|jgi:hypothetical protein|nr:hypothetical protein [Methylomirabilota bacterium]